MWASRLVVVRWSQDGARVIRPYTPISHPGARGHFELLFKVYEMGKMTRHLANLSVGDAVEMRGPTGRFNFRKLLPPLDNLALVCGGTGLTPMLQLLRCVARFSPIVACAW